MRKDKSQNLSMIGVIAAGILLIIDREVLWAQPGTTVTPTQRLYRRFLYGAFAHDVTDAAWSIWEACRLTVISLVDTTVHFLAMIAACR